MAEVLYREEAFAIVGCCFEVYNDKGPGFLEPVYQECLEIEFAIRQLPCSREQTLFLNYKGRQLQKTYQPDFLCFDKIILEVKAVSILADEHRAQVHNYLRATELRLGLLVNFGSFGKLQYELNSQMKIPGKAGNHESDESARIGRP